MEAMSEVRLETENGSDATSEGEGWTDVDGTGDCVKMEPPPPLDVLWTSEFTEKSVVAELVG